VAHRTARDTDIRLPIRPMTIMAIRLQDILHMHRRLCTDTRHNSIRRTDINSLRRLSRACRTTNPGRQNISVIPLLTRAPKPHSVAHRQREAVEGTLQTCHGHLVMA